MKERRYAYFRPKRMASWWSNLDDILWPEKRILDRIRHRADGFAEAGIDTAINFGFHCRFDFANYFGQLHGYYATVCDELHRRGIKFLDHYSCNTLIRPKGPAELKRTRDWERIVVLLHPDPIAAEHAQYAGHRYRDLLEVDVRDGSRAHCPLYNFDLFCHNNPDFLDMHRQYLQRLMAEVPLDGMEVDDMGDYGGFATCGCPYCRERFRTEYGRELPPVSDRSFWGDVDGPVHAGDALAERHVASIPSTWGNYRNPAFRDWVRMRTDSVADHVRMVKATIGDLPLMTCCSHTGPVFLNAVSLNLEKMSPHLDLLMMENVGIATEAADWVRMEAEALQQKAIARIMGDAPAIALSYTIFDDSGYLGWSLARYWGVCNWSSTLHCGLDEDPAGARETHEIVGPFNIWERRFSDLDFRQAADLAEVRLFSDRHCRDNGWQDEAGAEHWDRIRGWTRALVEQNVGYRILTADEMEDLQALAAESAPLIVDGAACISDRQFSAFRNFLAGRGRAVLRLPFGTHDEKGFTRPRPLSDELLENRPAGLRLDASPNPAAALEALVASGDLSPRLRQLSGDRTWAVRMRPYAGRVALHLLNRALEPVPHPTIRDLDDRSRQPILHSLRSTHAGSAAEYLVDFGGLGEPWLSATLRSPELGSDSRPVGITTVGGGHVRIRVPLEGIRIYAVVEATGR